MEAQATASMRLPWAIICFTALTRTVMPRSLNDPVWELPQSLIQSSATPRHRPRRSAQKRFVPPSYIETMLSSSICGSTHSFLPQTPDP